MAHIITIDSKTPSVDQTCFVAPTATLSGDVTLGARASAFYGVSVRGDSSVIKVGEGTNLQDNVVLHADPGFPCTIGDRVSVGHAAVVHGATVGNDCLIGMSATIMNGSVIGENSLVAAGAVVLEGTVVPRVHWLRVRAKVRRELTDEEVQDLKDNAARYLVMAAKHRDANAAR